MLGWGRGKRIEEKLDMILEILENSEPSPKRRKSLEEKVEEQVKKAKWAMLMRDLNVIKNKLNIRDDEEDEESQEPTVNEIDPTNISNIIDSLPIFRQLGPLAPIAKSFVKNWLSNPENLKMLTAISEHQVEKEPKEPEVRKDKPIDTALLFKK